MLDNRSVGGLAAALALASSASIAAGLQRWQQDASALGNAYAGTAASAESASTVFYNPAAMTRLPARQLAVSVVGEGYSLKFADRGSVAPATGGDGGDAGTWSATGAAYFAMQVAPAWRVGFAVNSPFGLNTEYASGWAGRYQALKSDFQTITVTPALAWQVSDKVSLGLGVSYQSMDVELSAVEAAGTPFGLDADDGGWGYTIGVLLTPSQRMRVGVSYRSSIEHELEGSAESGGGAGNGSARMRIKTPDVITVSAFQKLTEQWDMLGELSYTNHDKIRSLDTYYSSGVLLRAEPLKMDSDWRLAFGGNYRYSDAWKLRFGLAYERSPISDGDRVARMPDQRRFWLSAGVRYTFAPGSALDIGYSHIFIKDAEIQSTANVPAPGVLIGEYKSSVDLVGAQFTQDF